MALEKNNANEETMKPAYSTYRLNYKFVNILIFATDFKDIISAFFSRNNAIINNSIKETSRMYVPQGITIDDAFLDHLSKDLQMIHDFIYIKNVNMANRVSINDFVALNQFISYAYSLTQFHVNASNKIEMQKYIIDFVNELNITLSVAYKKKKKNQISR